jgi:small subunit ribosomal protein S1
MPGGAAGERTRTSISLEVRAWKCRTAGSWENGCSLMSTEITPELLPLVDADTDSNESFTDLLAEFEQSHSHMTDGAANQKEGTVVSKDAESVYVDIGYKTEGVLLRATFPKDAEEVNPGDKLIVTVRGRNPEGYYELSRIQVATPKDWTSMEEAFAQKAAVPGTVTGVVKGGLTVDIGMRAFMPSSRSGTRDAAEMEKLVGQEITCRIIKLDTEEEDVVVDRRVILEEAASLLQVARFGELKVGDVVNGQVRSLATYGAFVDLGGLDGLLHISDMAWTRVKAPEDVLSVGEQVQVKILSIDPETKKLSLGLKQLQPEPWDAVPGTLVVGQRVTGTVTRLTDFGAFVELQPGIEGLIHVSEMSWVKKVRKPSDMLKEGETVEAVVLSISTEEKRISLGLKQALGDPWQDAAAKFAVGSEVEGQVTRMMAFGAFVQVAEGIEGLVHVSEIVADRRINHPSDVLRVGETVKAQVVAVDAEKRQIRLSMKQLIPTGLTEYLEEHKVGDTVSGRVVEIAGDSATIELGEGIRAICALTKEAAKTEETSGGGALDLSSLTSMLNAKWKSGAVASEAKKDQMAVGQIRSFRIAKLDAEAKKIELTSI